MSAPSPTGLPGRIGQVEFIALSAMLVAMIAFSIDAILPALPDMAAELTPTNPNAIQSIIIAFVFGMGIATLFTGPLSDSFGRKRIILFGGALFILGALIAYLAESLEMILIGRFIQGIGAGGPRVAAFAVIRDLYSGRQMARIMSFVMMIFTLFPAVAPLIGSWIIFGFGWRSILLAFILFALVAVGWNTIRQAETLPVDRRTPFRLGTLTRAIVEVTSNRIVQVAIVVQSLIFGMLFGIIATVQLVFDQSYDKADSFPYYFGAIALISGIPSLLNAAIVVRVGMRRLIMVALYGLTISSTMAIGLFYVVGADQTLSFWIYFVWVTTVFSSLGLTIGNLNALGMEPMGHIAGTAASVIGAISTVLGGAIGAVLGQSFNGSVVPFAAGTLVLAVLSIGFMRFMPSSER